MYMFMNRNDEAAIFSQSERPYSQNKTVSIRGSSQQILKQCNGNSINYDYEMLHYLDQMK